MRIASDIRAALRFRRLFPSLGDTAVTLEMPKELEAEFSAAAKALGVFLSDYLRDFIVEHHQDAEDDFRAAQERLENPQAGISSIRLRKNLGQDG
jgi:predicted DNA-binding protein